MRIVTSPVILLSGKPLVRIETLEGHLIGMGIGMIARLPDRRTVQVMIGRPSERSLVMNEFGKSP